MPIYEYKCGACDYEFEALQKISDKPLTECPACNENALKKKISAVAFRLKGSGWYETDFKSGNKKNLAGDDKNNDSTAGKADSAATSGAENGGAGKSSAEKGSTEKPAAKTDKPATSTGKSDTSK